MIFRHMNKVLSRLTMTNPIHREIYNSLNSDKRFAEKLRRMFTDALESVKNENNKPAAKRAEAKSHKTTNEKYSIKMSTDGERYVQVDEDVIDTSDGASIANNIRIILESRFKNLILANGQFVRVNIDTNGEIRYPLRLKSRKYHDKLKALANADEILSTANNWINEDEKDKKKKASKAKITSYGRGKVLFKVGERGYSADVLVGVKKDGSAVLYYIENIQRKEITDADGVGKGTKALSNGKTTSVKKTIPHVQAESQDKLSQKPVGNISEEDSRLIEENENYKALIGKLNRHISELQKKVVDPKGVRKLAHDVRAEYRSAIPQADRFLRTGRLSLNGQGTGRCAQTACLFHPAEIANSKKITPHDLRAG